MRAHSTKNVISLAALCAATLPAVAMAQNLSATAPAKHYDLPSQDLGQALDRISAHYGIAIEINRTVIRGWRSRAVVDAVNVDDAIRQALAGTGLSANRSSDGTSIGIGKPDPARLADDVVVMAPRSQAETSYKADSSDTANRSGAPSRSLPYSSSVVTAQVLKDQQAISVDDAVRNIASVKNNDSSVQGGNFYQVRGFVANVLTNGVATPGNLYQGIDTVERVEVLKGPAAILQGEGSLGGTVNVVTKKPTTTTLLDLEAQVGSYREYKIAVDGSTRLSESGPLSARVILSGLRQGRTFGGYDGAYQELFAPSLRYKDHRLDVTVGLDYSDVSNPFPAYTAFAADTGKLIDRRTRNAIGFRDANFKFESTNVHGDLQYDVAPWLTVVARGSHVDLKSSQRYFFSFGNVTTTHDSAFTGDAPYFVTGLGGGQANDYGTWSGDSYLRAKVTTGPVRHTISAGYNLRVSDGETRSLNASGLYTFDIRSDAAIPSNLAYSEVGSNRDFTRSQGYYLQDLIEFGPAHLFGAIRRNIYTDRYTSQYFNQTTHDAAWTPSGGLVVDLSKAISIFGNFSKGYFPGDARTYEGVRLPPIQSQQFEGGLKADLNRSGATLALSGFQITQKNNAQVDPRSFSAPTATCNNVTFCYVLAGGLRSRGIEAELQGEILPGWNITLSGTRSWYSYFQQQIALTGDPYASLVKARGSLFTVYSLRQGALKGFGIGGGLTAQSGSSAGTVYDYAPGTFALLSTHNVRVPGYVRTDLSLYYRTRIADLALGVRNVFDNKNYSEATVPSYVPVLPPRTFRLSITFHGFAQ